MKRFVLVFFFLQMLLARAAFAEDAAAVFLREGADANRAGNVSLAYEKFKAAWALRRTFDIAANLGAVEVSLGKKRDAAEHLEFALRNFPSMGEEPQRAQLSRMLEQVRKEVGELRITSATGALIEVNGQQTGTCPLPGPIFVEPGQQIIVAKKPDVGEGKILVVVNIGEGKDIRVELSLSSGGGKSEPLPIWPGFIIGGAGVAAAAVGIGLTVVGQNNLSTVDELGDRLRAEGGHCQPPSGSYASACDDAEKKVASAGTLTSAGVTLLSIGGTLLVGGLLWIVIPREESSSEQRAMVMPYVSTDGAGVVAGGRF